MGRATQRNTRTWLTRGGRSSELEWPTLALAVVIYGGWLLVTLYSTRLPAWLLAGSGAWLVAWQSSLQHECLHGHPTRWRWLNRAIAYPPLSLWMPYARYRAMHLAHHRDERLTDPLDDPESRYLRPEDWQALGAAGRLLVRAQATLLGRMVIGPFWAIGGFVLSEVRAIGSGNTRVAGIWVRHLVSVAALLAWLQFVCGLSVLMYAGLIVLPATSLMLIRSFAEHRANEAVPKRTAIVEGAHVLGPLYLFNNLHAAHHERPDLAWYRLPAWYEHNRERLIADNGGLVYRGYGEIARRFLMRPHDAPLHPHGRVPGRGHQV